MPSSGRKPSFEFPSPDLKYIIYMTSKDTAYKLKLKVVPICFLCSQIMHNYLFWTSEISYWILDNKILTSGLIVCAILNLAYSKEHVYYILLIYSMISLFQNLLYSSV